MDGLFRGRTILLVEDNVDVRTIFSEVFKNEGYRVLEATNGREAYDLMMGSDDSVNVVLTDLRMPIMDGSSWRSYSKITRDFLPFRLFS